MRLFMVLALVLMCALPAVAAERESAYDRIMRTGVIRCGYAVWTPVFMKDPNTGAMSGVYHDYMNKVAERLGFTIDWSYELNLSTYIEDLNAGKYDVECSGGWPNAQRGKYADYTTPIYYNPVYLYVRADDTRFDADRGKINAPEARFVTMVGEQSEAYRREYYPLSTEISVPGTAQLSEILMQLLYKKADISFCDEASAQEFEKLHPGVIRRLPGDPVKVIPSNLSVAKGEAKLVTMLNTATEELLNEGAIDRLLDKYNLSPVAAPRVARPYRTP